MFLIPRCSLFCSLLGRISSHSMFLDTRFRPTSIQMCFEVDSLFVQAHRTYKLKPTER